MIVGIDVRKIDVLLLSESLTTMVLLYIVRHVVFRRIGHENIPW